MHPLIVGLGLQTALGTNVAATWAALCAGRFISDHSRVPVDFAAGTSRIAEIAMAAAHECVSDAGIPIAELRDSDIPLVVGTSKGPIEQWLRHRNEPSCLAGDVLSPLLPSRAEERKTAMGHRPLNEGLQPAGLAGLAAQVAGGLGLAGPRLTLSAACASGLHALIRGALMVRCGQARRVLVVAAESSLHPLFVGNFQRLGVLPPAGFGCRPFDLDRKGFVMSEAAAAVLLEADGLSRSARRRAIAVERFALAGDAIHLTGSDPESRTLRRILSEVIDHRPLDLVHAHGTGTDVNDTAEIFALEETLMGTSGPPRLAGDVPSPVSALRGWSATTAMGHRPLNETAEVGPRPSLYSHKGALGHSLGASGLVSVVLNCMSHQTGIVPGNVRTDRPLESSRLQIRQAPCERDVTRSLAIAAGFGGAMGAVSLVSLLSPAGAG